MKPTLAHRLEGVLLTGTEEEKESLLRVIEKVAPDEHLRVYCWTAANRSPHDHPDATNPIASDN